MPSAWTQNYYHCLWGTKHRTSWIRPETEARVHAFLGGIAKDLDCKPVEINGMAMHVHVLVRFPSKLAVSVLVQNHRSRSTSWIQETCRDLSDFSWQVGYGGFTVSKSAVDDVAEYIRNQKVHHEKMTFETEYVSLLRKAGWEGDPRELFD